MSSSNVEPEPAQDATETSETTETSGADDPSSTVGKLTVEDDPEGTVDPSDLAGTASDSDADVS
jgi:hypothetical protein